MKSISKIKRQISTPLAAIAIAFALLAVSCTENPVAIGDHPSIFSVSKQKTFIGDTVAVYGSSFGGRTPLNGIMFSDSVFVSSLECIRWTQNMIQLEVPIGASSGTFAVLSDSIISNRHAIEISPIPPIELVEIPAGEFTMGSSIGLDNEMPPHKVRLTKSFEISKYEVTTLLWHSVTGLGAIDAHNKNLPVDGISWLEAIDFCNRLSELLGYEKCYEIVTDTITQSEYVICDWGADGFRLPTEAEWEYACRGGTNSDFCGGESTEVAWYNANSGYKPHPVGRKTPNLRGIFDMQGNVREWCWDYYSADYFSISPNEDPKGPESGSLNVIRGGAWHDGISHCRATNRTFADAIVKGAGIRPVRTIKK